MVIVTNHCPAPASARPLRGPRRRLALRDRQPGGARQVCHDYGTADDGPADTCDCVREGDAPIVAEAVLQAIWNEGRFRQPLRCADGTTVEVIHPGTWNVSAGPDFHDAVLVLDGHLRRGAVEIHHQPEYWVRHGHHRDPAYRDTLLHVVWHNPRGLPTCPPGVPLLVLDGQLAEPLAVLAERYAPPHYPYACKVAPSRDASWLHALDDRAAAEQLQLHGLARSLARARELAVEIETRGLEATVYRRLLDGLGYQANRPAFAALATRLSLAELRSAATRSAAPERTAQALLFGAAGLLPDPTCQPVLGPWRPWVDDLWERWWPARTGEATAPLPWRRTAGRPANSPERRLLAAATLLPRHHWQLGAALIRLAAPGREVRQCLADLLAAFVVDLPERADFLHFGRRLQPPARLLGESRARDLVVNLAIPLCLAVGLQRSDAAACRHARALLLACPLLQDNRRLQEAAHRFLVPPSRQRDVVRNAAAQQGLLQLHHDHLRDPAPALTCD